MTKNELFEITPFRCLPCSLEVFTIKGVNADTEDFGNNEGGGNCMDNSCRNEFVPKLPTEEVLEKYNINLAEYEEICEALEDELFVCGCGWCS